MNLLRLLFNKFGYELTAAKKSPSLRSHLGNLFAQYKIDVVLDVGANNGQFATLIRDLGYQGDIYSFEPVAKTFEQLFLHATQDKKWHVVKLGLGDCVCKKTINVSQSSDLCSLLPPSDFGKTVFPKIEISEQETIDIDTIDAFLLREKIPPHANIFLKMDTQGYDIKVFHGAKDSLNRVAGILSELSFIPIYEGSPHYLESLDIFEKNGFMVSGLYPVSKNTDLTIIEMDCVLINTKRNTQLQASHTTTS